MSSNERRVRRGEFEPARFWSRNFRPVVFHEGDRIRGSCYLGREPVSLYSVVAIFSPGDRMRSARRRPGVGSVVRTLLDIPLLWSRRRDRVWYRIDRRVFSCRVLISVILNYLLITRGPRPTQFWRYVFRVCAECSLRDSRCCMIAANIRRGRLILSSGVRLGERLNTLSLSDASWLGIGWIITLRFSGLFRRSGRDCACDGAIIGAAFGCFIFLLCSIRDQRQLSLLSCLCGSIAASSCVRARRVVARRQAVSVWHGKCDDTLG